MFLFKFGVWKATEKPCSEVLLAQISCLSRAGENGGNFVRFVEMTVKKELLNIEKTAKI